jgi:acetyl-CoA C-acetyltransferase
MKIAVLGAYQTKFGELWYKSLDDLILEASWGAIEDAGIDKKRIEIAFIGNKLAGNLSGQNHLTALLAQLLEVNIPVVRIEAACASGGTAVAQACLAIASGQYESALVVGAEKMTDLPIEEVSLGLMSAADLEEQESGLSFVGLYALMAKKYLEDFGARREDLAFPAIKNHFHASLNEKAQFPFLITLNQVIQSPIIADPLRLLECSPISDGAAALVLASPRLVKKRTKNKVFIVASGQASESLSLSKRKNLTEIDSTKKAAFMTYKKAGITPKDISLLEVHDCFSIAEIIALEDLGIYAKGEGYLAQRNGEVKLGGPRPVNLSGGLKACGHPVGATGVKQIVEIVNQLRERGGKRQVENPKVGLAHNVGGTGGTAVVHILQK